jgi:putative hydrolase of the HAD superfamily
LDVGRLNRPRAVLLDALGTLLELEPPGPALRAQLAADGIALDGRQAAQAFAAEIAYYRAHHLEGRDAESVADLRRRCALALRDALPPAARPEQQRLIDLMVAALRFRVYDDVVPALERLRAAGVAVVVVSNWDWSLHERLEETGLSRLVDGAVTSAEAGAGKPGPAIFGHALAIAGVAAQDAVHVGDNVGEDVEGARAAGVEPILLARDARRPPPGVASIGSLEELAPLLSL